MKKPIIEQKAPPQLERFLTPAETGAIIRFHPESVRRGIRQGRIRAQRIGKKLIIAESEVRRIVAEGIPPLTA